MARGERKRAPTWEPTFEQACRLHPCRADDETACARRAARRVLKPGDSGDGHVMRKPYPGDN